MHLIHDLRIVLMVIGICLEHLRTRYGAGPLPEPAQRVEQLVEMGRSIIEELLVSTELRPSMTHIDVNRLIEEFDGILREIVGPHVALRTSLAARESRIYARRVDLERIVLNLVFNAAAAMPEGGVLTIETTSAPPEPHELWVDPAAPFGDLRLMIGDTGRGMSESEVQRVNNPLARPRPDGTGMGLASVSLVVARLDGKLEISSQPGAGTIVGITLPLAPSSNGPVH